MEEFDSVNFCTMITILIITGIVLLLGFGITAVAVRNAPVEPISHEVEDSIQHEDSRHD